MAMISGTDGTLNNSTCKTCPVHATVEGHLDLSEDEQNPSSIQAHVMQENGKYKLVLRQGKT